MPISRDNPRLVLIGWHGADWKAIHPLVDAGLMPNLRSVIERGVAGNLKASGPLVPAMIPAALWTSLSTGKTGEQHGVMSAVEPDPLSGTTRPVGSESRRVKALWNIATQCGLRTHVVNWCATHPAEKLNGSCVSDAFVRPLARHDAPWPILPGSVHPPQLASELAALRVHAGELTGADLKPFVPRFAEIDQESDRRLISFADCLAQAVSTHAIATRLLEREPWDLMMIGWSAMERVCQLFMRCERPQLPGTSTKDCELYGGVLRAFYSYHDLMLGRILELAGPDTTIAIVSAGGYRTAEERPISPSLQAQPAAWCKPYGIFCIAGPGIVADELVHGVGLLDIVPTMLSVLNLPRAADMPGNMITNAFQSHRNDIPDTFQSHRNDTADTFQSHRDDLLSREGNRAVVEAPEPIPTWENIAGECGMEPRTADEKAQHRASVAIHELAAMGYTDPAPAGSPLPANRQRLLETALTQVLNDRPAEARAALLKLHEPAPDPGTALLLAYCHYRCGDFVAAAIALSNAPRDGLAGAHARILESYLENAQGNTRKAVAAIASAERLGFDRPVVNWIVGSLYARLGQWSRAEDALRCAVELDPSMEHAPALLARVLVLRGKAAEASQVALHGLAADYSSASLHSALGVALLQTGDEERALQAFETSLTFDPRFREASLWVENVKARAQSLA